MLITQEKSVPPTQAELQAELESGKPARQIAAMKKLIILMLNGEPFSNLLMTVIRFVAPSENHELKKLACLYWETVDKHSEDGKLLPETILVCNALLQNLKHPNEYIRAYTLRFLCRVKEAPIVEPLVAAVKENLEHRHSLVRRTAVMAVFQIAKEFGDDLLPDADELIDKFLVNESDQGARRNAFLMLYQCSQDKAIDFFASNLDSVAKFGDGFQLVILELTRRVCRGDPSQKSRFIKIIFQLLQSPSSAVCFEAAWTLVSLSSAPTAVRAAAQTYTQLLNAESDNNVKLIVLEKLAAMRRHHAKVLQELLMDILRALNSPNSSIRRKSLAIVMELVSPRNVSEVMLVLKKEIIKTQSKDVDRESANEYRAMLVKAIHTCAIKFASVADSVVHLLMDFLAAEGAHEVILFVREIVQIYPKMRASVVGKLVQCLPEIKAAQVHRVALWILGEYAEARELRAAALAAVYECLGPLPFQAGGAEGKAEGGEEQEEEAVAALGAARKPVATTKVTVLADGTYATQTAFSVQEQAGKEAEQGPALRKLMLAGNYLLGAAAVAAGTKILLRDAAELGAADAGVKQGTARLLVTCCSLIQAGKSAKGPARMDKDSYERISFCMRALMDPAVQKDVAQVMLHDSRAAFAKLIEVEHARDKENALEPNALLAQPDALIHFRQLKERRALGADELDLDDEAGLAAAASDKAPDLARQLAHVYQLTGFSDPVYVEAQLTVHEYDIVLDILVINRTNTTLSNLTVELYTVGDLKLVERPQSYNIGPNDHRRFKANIKVSSTETGQIFGTVVYDSSTSAGSSVINLNEIPVEIMDYIHPATCSDSAYRQMWAEFEWENKVGVNTHITDVDEFLDHIIASTNMSCLTPRFAKGQSSFLAANLYAKSVFGEDALVNVSVEKVQNKVEGYIRIRAKTQGIALSLGDRVTMCQRETHDKGTTSSSKHQLKTVASASP